MSEKRFTIRLDAEMNINQVKSAVQQMQTELDKLKLPQDIGNKLSGTFGKLMAEIERFQGLSAKGIGSTKDFNAISTSGNKIIQLYNQLSAQVKNLGALSDSELKKLIPQSALNNIKKASEAWRNYESDVKKSQTAIVKQKKAIEEQEASIQELEKALTKAQNMKIVGTSSELNKLGSDVAAAKSELESLEAQAEQVSTKMSEMAKAMSEKGNNSPRKSSTYRDLEKQLADLRVKIENARTSYNSLQTQFSNTTTAKKQADTIRNLSNDLQSARNKLTEMVQELGKMESADGAAAINKLVTALNQIPGINIDPTTASLKDIEQVIQRLSSGEIEKLRTNFSQVGTVISGTGVHFQTLGQNIQNTEDKVRQLNASMSEIEGLKSRINYFFGLTNSVYLLRRALSGAFQTVKTLDATMTEAAVVTDFSVGDMWDKLPQYAAEANKLGTSINSLYAATTLYYQQGLKSNEAMALGVETMKMARIAGMESSEATEAMTAALRGFNMELTEASATRINDVYSELAAITAADTEQIATAMSKTASIASSANMEFETTAALLAQIIETTQEAPETAGTAMKTIIARFTEVKELFSEGQLTGTDDEGEAIDINKIDTALKTVGISLKDFLNGSKGIDDIFLELASKWDDLDLATQRYIATMAAGSRQQSRFIAMMSNYDRTMELVSAANNSAGASSTQFNKTLESMDAKLNRLKTAWEQFLMGITNSELIKDGIDLLTDLLEIINKITTVGGKSSDAFSLLSKIGLTYGGMKVGKKILNKGITSLVASFQNAGEEGAKNLIFGFNKNLTSLQLNKQNLIDDLLGAKKNFTKNNNLELLSANLTQLQTKYNLTDAQVAQFSTTIQKNGVISDEVSQIYTSQVKALEAQRKAQIKSTATMVGIIVALYAILALTELMKKGMNKAIVTTEEKMSDLKNLEEETTESTSKLSQELENLGDTKKNLRDMSSEIKNLKKGTSQWASTVHSVRTQMYGILDTYPDLKNYTEVVNGVTVLTDEGWAAYETKLLTSYYKEMQTLYGTKIQLSELQKIQKAEALNVQTNTITSAEQEKIIQHQTYGSYIGGGVGAVAGWAAGTAIGTKIGSAIGTAIAPGIGTAIGAVLGLALGTGIGYLTGGGVTADEGISPSLLNEVALKAATYTQEGKSEFLAEEAVSAENSTELITNFLEESGLEQGTEDFQTMFDYISENAKEFDSHSQYLASANAQLLEFGKRLGEVNAEEKGYTGEAAETYSAISAILTSTEFKSRYQEEYNNLLEQVGDISSEGFTITSQALIDEFLDKYGNEFELRNNKIYYKGTETEITDSTFLGRIASNRVNLDIAEEAEEIFDLVGHDSAMSSLYKWQASGSKVIPSEATDNANLQDIHDLISTGYSVLATAKKLPDFEDLYWDIFQKAWTDQTYTTGPIEYQWEDLEAAEVPYASQDSWTKNSREDKLTAWNAEGNLESYNPNNYANASDWINAHDSVYDSTWDVVEFFLGDMDPETRYSPLNKGKATVDLVNDKDEIEAAAEQIYPFMKDQALAWTLYWNEGIDSFGTNLQSLVEQYDTMMKWTYNTGYEYYTYDEEGNRKYNKVQDGYGFNFLANVDWSNAQAFIKQFEKIETTYNLEELLPEGKTLAGYFKEIAGTITDNNQLSQVMNTLAQTDFDNLTELRTTVTYLQTLGVPDETISSIETMIEDFKDAGIAVADIDLETLIEQIENTTKVIDKINDLEVGSDLTFSEEELNTMISAGASREDFFATTDGFVYLGQSIDSLRSTLISTNSILLGLQMDALRAKIATANKIEDSNLEDYAWGATGTWSDATIREVFAKAIGATTAGSSAYKGSNVITKDNISDFTEGTLLESLDQTTVLQILQGTKFSDLSNPTQAGISELLANWGDAFINKTSYETQLNTGLTTASQQQLSIMTGEELLRADESTFNVTDEVTGEVKDNIGMAMDANIQQNDLQKNYDDLSNSIGWNSEKVQENQKLLKAHTISSNEGAEAIDDMNKVLSNQSTILKNSKKESTAYKKAISQVTESAKKVFGDHIDTTFVEENIELFNDLAEGGEVAEEAWKELGKLSGNKFLETLNLTETQLEAVNTQVKAIDGMQLSIGGSADFSAIFGQLAAVMGGAAQAEAYIESLGGYEVTWVQAGFTTNELTGEQMPNYIAIVTKTDETGTGVPPSGGGGGGGEPQEWENPYDKYYNTVQKLNEELRERERLERKYQKLVKSFNTSSADLTKNKDEQLASLKSEKETREWLKQRRIEAMGDIESEYSEYSEYAWYNEETGTIEIDWDKINALDGSTDEEFTEGLEEYISALEDGQDLIHEEEDALADIEDAIQDIYEQGKDQYFDLETKVKEAVEASYQKEIDELSAINDSINDTNSKLIDAMQTAIDKQRQERENEETEEELAEKQRRLVYLQQDTSGANQQEILELQKEIEEGQEDYTDSLIDQKITELQQQNDKAAEQREQQIAIAQAQLDHYVASGEIWNEVYSLLDEGIDENGLIIDGSRLMTLLQENEEYASMSRLGKIQWAEDLKDLIAEGLSYLRTGQSTEALLHSGELKEGQQVTFYHNGQEITGTLDKDGNVTTADGQVYEDVYRGYDGKFYSEKGPKEQEEAPPEAPAPEAPKLTTEIKRGVSAAIWNGNYGWGHDPYRKNRLKEVFGENDIQKNYVNKRVMSGYPGKLSDYSYANMKKKFTQYKTGGLADFTGPAWLDGTKSKPEYILNAEQTKRFFTLIDVLSSLQHPSAQSTENSGDTTYDIDINVETIGSDYDVEQMADKIKDLINADARYRNNNAISNSR